jgi:hypothetical protein
VPEFGCVSKAEFMIVTVAVDHAAGRVYTPVVLDIPITNQCEEPGLAEE